MIRYIARRLIRESPQELDPLGGLSARMLVYVACVVVPVLAIATTVGSMREVSNPALSVLAILVIIVACAYYVRATSPFRVPFSRGSHAFVCLLALLSVGLDALGQAGTNSLVRDDWAPVAIAALTVTFGAYRPAGEILAFALAATVAVGAIVFAGSASYAANVPPIVFAVLGSMPVLACGVAASAISHSLVTDLRAWRERGETPDDVAVIADEPGVVLESTVAHHRALAERGAVPFLRSIVDADHISEDDAALARDLSSELRALMILDDQQRWVTRLVTGVDDPHRLSDGMDPDQRGCLRAIVTHVESSGESAESSLGLSFAFDSGKRPLGRPPTVCCTLAFDIRSARNTRVRLGPFIAIARAVFSDATIEFAGDRATIRLSFPATKAALRDSRARRARSEKDDPDRDSPLRHATVDS